MVLFAAGACAKAGEANSALSPIAKTKRRCAFIIPVSPA
jgi:hypothetical protein